MKGRLRCQLHEGEATLIASLSADEWTSIFGQRGAEVPNEFNHSNIVHAFIASNLK